MMGDMTVAVLHGELPDNAGKDEQDTLEQVKAVSYALADLGYEPVTVPLGLNLQAFVHALDALRPLFVFNLVESIAGRGSLIHVAPAILDALNIPYTGSRREAQYLTSNKLLAKRILFAAGIDTPPWFSPGEPHIAAHPQDLWIVKSVWEHASIGLDEDSLIRVKAQGSLAKVLKERAAVIGGPCFAEMFIEGREFNLSLLGGDPDPEVLAPAEIRFVDYPPEKPRVVGYRAKWDETSFEYHHTPRSFDFPDEDHALIVQLSELALRCWSLFNLRGYARVDFRVDHHGRPWVLEINANPCISPDAGFIAAAGRQGLSYQEVIERIIRDSLPQRAA